MVVSPSSSSAKDVAELQRRGANPLQRHDCGELRAHRVIQVDDHQSRVSRDVREVSTENDVTRAR